MAKRLPSKPVNDALFPGKFNLRYYRSSCLSILVGFFLFQISSACKSKPEELVGPTTGKINIISDESIRDIVEQEREIFESTYKYARLLISYDSEYNALKRFFNDSVDVVFTTRALTTEELDYFHQKKVFPKQVHFASGALAFIVSKQSPDTAFTYEQFKIALSDSSKGKSFVIENAESGIANQIMQIIGKSKLPSHFFAKPSKDEVIAYIRLHRDAIGIIDYSAISDSDAAYSNEILNSVQLVALTRPKDSLQKGFIKPFQYNLQDEIYPFTRALHLITKTGLNDVSTGFSAFITGDIGQKIVLKAGLLPMFQSERWIELKSGSKPKVEK